MLIVLQLAAAAREKEVAAKITGLAVLGNENVAAQEIFAAIFSKVGEIIDKDKVNNDLKAIYALGYFKDVAADFDPYLDGTRIVYNVEENPTLESIGVQGNTVYSTAEIMNVLGLKTGQVFNFKTFRSGIEGINRKYKQDGYTMARVTDVSAEAGIVEIKLTEGMVEGITLEGNEATKDYVIMRELNTTVGSVFNENVLSKDLRRVFNLGFFSEINPIFEPGTSSDKIVLRLKVKETRTNTVNFGGGYGEREGWFGFADLSVANLAGTAQGLLLKGQTGQQLATYQFRYTNPWFWPEKFGKRLAYTLRLWDTLGTDIYITQQDEKHIGWDMSFGKTYNDVFGSTITVGSESLSPRGSASFEAYTSPYIGYSLSYDTRDFWMNPRGGVYHTLSFKQGWKYASSQTNYFKVSADFNGYSPWGENQVLAKHFGVGMGFNDVPLGELYWVAGPNTVRGYSLDEIRRGVKRVLANIEYRYTVNDVFQGVFFFDWGNAWNAGEIDISQFIAGWGPGVRVNTPLGPIRLDYGIGTSKSFSEGILHFSIGQAF